ncbi:LysR family transcriptional regulator [Catellatospora tritici]|uniref:LysR family transcriptional regulator n=1 Tax=Catellatospora tritici TaxID=2851566 RepID=UPI001C2D1AE3|nr:LysR family transcriptional regulator [Catellatospora tritici]MBV1855573.1 LysR family transcriptional regulator [Catellatospora tritici]
MSIDLDIRLLRHFLAVAEELNFTRAAQRLFVAQQVLSRQVQQLETRIGTPLLVRSTRRVALTPAGRTLLDYARELVALHDRMLREVRGERAALVVDVCGPDLLPARILDAARGLAPQVEFFARFHHEPADVRFGLRQADGTEWAGRTVWHEPLAVLLPADHPLARLDAVPLTALPGTRLCVRAGSQVSPAWDDLVSRLLAPVGLSLQSSHPQVYGADELARHLRERDAPILALATTAVPPDAVLRPLAEPDAVFAWAMMWRRTLRHPGLDALHAAVSALPATPADH